MLVLTRRIGETIRIGPDVLLTVLGVKGSQVRIGIDAPKEVAVHREEILDRIQREQTTDRQHPSSTDDLGRAAGQLEEE